MVRWEAHTEACSISCPLWRRELEADARGPEKEPVWGDRRRKEGRHSRWRSKGMGEEEFSASPKFRENCLEGSGLTARERKYSKARQRHWQ